MPRESILPVALDEEASPLKLLVIDDDALTRAAVQRYARSHGLLCESFADPVEALAELDEVAPDVIMTDYNMPGMDGLSLLQAVLQRDPEMPVILMSGIGDFQLAVTALKAGAFDLLVKPFESPELAIFQVVRAARQRRLRRRNHMLEREVVSRFRFGELIGESPAMAPVYRFIERVARTQAPVLVLGESGTGKELVARAIHHNSRRADLRLVTVNCAAIPRDLIESELFGHVRGAFTGAAAARAGLFEAADKGTIFLDELGELPLPAQAQLLRTLQQGEIRRVGSDETKVVDTRIIAATNAELEQRIESGEFRKDLFYRLNVFTVHLPPLRERGRDVLLLARYFLERLEVRTGEAKTLSADAENALLAHDWPGNVRELENAIERAHTFSEGSVIEAAQLPSAPHETSTTRLRVLSPSVEFAPLAAAPPSGGELDPRIASELLDLPYAEAKRRLLAIFDGTYGHALLQRTGGNLTEAARLAGLDRSNFRRVIKKTKRDTPSGVPES